LNELERNQVVVAELVYKARNALGAALMSVALAACGGGGDGDAAAARGESPAGGVVADGAAAGAGGTGVVPDNGTSAGAGGIAAGASAGVTGDSGIVPRVASAPGATTLSWLPPTMTEEGEPLQLTGYRIYWGPTEDYFPYSVTLKNPGLTRYVVEQLAPATWYFVATALSDKGESAFSNVIAMQVR
jgi:hypothetical protein